jgi:GNAT superfamily N-acetyltransferase
MLKRLAAQWWNGDEDPRVERTLAAAGWEIGQDEGSYDNGGAFVVQAGDVNGDSYISWPAEELEQGVAEGDVVQFPKKHASNLDDVHECVKCGGDLQGGTYMGQRIKVCIPCKQVYLSPNSNIDQQGNKISEQDIEENFADGQHPVKFTVTTPDGYTHSFQITLAVHGKHVGHFNFVRGADTDDVNNEAEVESRWQGQGYGKLLLMKAIDVANNHGLDFQQDTRGITDPQQNVYDSLENAGLIVSPGDGFWFLTPQGEQELNGLNENFADGKNPGRKGDSARHGIPKKASLTQLDKIGHGSGRKAQLARWQANMRRGRAK